MSRLNETEGQALVRPMYHDYPAHEEAYACPQQYLFGTDLIVAPYTAAADADTRLARQVVWLPPGDWYHFFSGEQFSGDTWRVSYGDLDDVPVFARAGAIIPMGPRVGWGGLENPEEIHLHVFAGADGRFNLYEDDGVSTGYRDGAFTQTRFEQRWDEERIRLNIAPASGDSSLIPARRTYHLHVYGISGVARMSVMIDGISRPLAYEYDAAKEIAHCEPLALDTTAQARLTIAADTGSDLLSRRDRTTETAHRMLVAFRMDSLAKAWLSDLLADLPGHPEPLASFGVELSPSQTRALLEVTQEVGVHILENLHDATLILLWNNSEASGFRHHLAQLRPHKWHVTERFGQSIGVTPRFRAIIPQNERWRLSVDYFGLQTLTFDGRRGD